MTLVLHLGVMDVPYNHGTPAPRRVAVRSRRGKPPTEHSFAAAGQATTGDVAEILEDKYGLFQAFFDAHGDEIAEQLANAAAGSLENILMGAPPSSQPFAVGTDWIKQRFQAFLDTYEAEYHVTGTPTKAALQGVNHRLKHPYSKDNPRRPSFIDTGLMSASFAAWIDGS